MSEDLTEIMIKEYKKRHLEGAIDTINAIQKSLIMTKEYAGKYPEMSDFVYELLPNMRTLNEKRLKELDNG